MDDGDDPGIIPAVKHVDYVIQPPPVVPKKEKQGGGEERRK
jgi:hypothetical protein